jgi:hypothetical protein
MGWAVVSLKRPGSLRVFDQGEVAVLLPQFQGCRHRMPREIIVVYFFIAKNGCQWGYSESDCLLINYRVLLHYKMRVGQRRRHVRR